jgi:hypothetical protein
MKAMAGLLNVQCGRCSELLLEYIAAGNETIEIQGRLRRSGQPPARQRTVSLLKRAFEKKKELRKQLVCHQQVHRVHSRSNS